MTSTSYGRTDVFISYSNEDAKYLERLKKHLAFYERSGLLSVWEDTKIAPGSLWRVEIEKAIKKTKIAILLVSADFLASEYIARTELPPLLAATEAEGAIIIPVILSPCAFKDTVLSQFQAVNSPSKPLSGMSRHEKEKMWAEIASSINMELSKTSEHKPDWMLGLPEDDDIRKITPATQISGMTSYVVELFKQFNEDEVFDYAIIDLGTGQNWLTSRLYIFAIMLERMRGLRCFVFLESVGEVDQRFLGIASLTKVRWALAYRYPWLETAFAQAYSSIGDPTGGGPPYPHITSATGALDRELAQQVVYYFLANSSIQQSLPSGVPPDPDDGEWESLTSDDGMQLWEHAKWLDTPNLRQDLDDILQQDESTWLIERPDITPTELVRSLLRRRAPFVALVDEEKRFRSLIDRQDLLERTVSKQWT